MPAWTAWVFLPLVGAVVLLFFVSYLGGSLNAVEFFIRKRSEDETLDESDADDR